MIDLNDQVISKLNDKITELEANPEVKEEKSLICSDDLLVFAKKHDKIISKAKLKESFETISKRIKYTEKLEK